MLKLNKISKPNKDAGSLLFQIFKFGTIKDSQYLFEENTSRLCLKSVCLF